MENKILTIIEESSLSIQSITTIKKYIEFCLKNNLNKHTSGITEHHHILPKAKSLFPQFSNLKENSWNGVFLTFENHYIAHSMLADAINHSSVIYAWNMMNKISKINAINLIGEHKYKILREAHSKTVIEYNKTRTVTKETRLKMGKATKGMVTVFDTIANKHRRVTKAEFDNNSTLLGGTPGMVSVRDTRDNTSKQVTQVEYHKYDYYVHTTKGLVTVIDTRDNKTKQVSKCAFNQHDYYVGTSTKIIRIYDNNDKLQYTSKIKFKDFCKNNSLPFNAFYESHTNNASRLYMSFPRKENETRVINNGNIKFKGWYAVSENF